MMFALRPSPRLARGCISSRVGAEEAVWGGTKPKAVVLFDA